MDFDLPPRFREQAIQELLDRDGITPSVFARRLGVSRQRVHVWLKGEISPQFTVVLLMCREFGVPPSFFADGLPPALTANHAEV
jgi:transcriptional regulator with XRE-family HTH domain